MKLLKRKDKINMYIQKCKSCKFSVKTMWTIKCLLNPYNCLSDGKYLLYKEK